MISLGTLSEEQREQDPILTPPCVFVILQMASLVIFLCCGLEQLLVPSDGMMSPISNVTGMAMDMSVRKFQDDVFSLVVFMDEDDSCNFTCDTFGDSAFSENIGKHARRVKPVSTISDKAVYFSVGSVVSSGFADLSECCSAVNMEERYIVMTSAVETGSIRFQVWHVEKLGFEL